MEITNSKNKTMAKIKYMLPQQELKYLGHTKAMNGCNHAEYNNLLTLVRDERAFFSISFLDQYENTIYYRSFHIPKVSFLMVKLSFSRCQLRHIQGPFDQILLQQLGFNQNTSKCITYSSRIYGSIGLKCFF